MNDACCLWQPLSDLRPLWIRLTNAEDKAWFDKTVTHVTQQHLGEEHVEDVKVEPYFVDFLRDAPEPTGEEPEDADLEAPKIYEKVRRSLFCIILYV